MSAVDDPRLYSPPRSTAVQTGASPATGPAEQAHGGSAVEVAEVLRLVLEPHACVLAGRAGLQRRVGWVTTLRGLPPIFESSGGDEVVLAPVATLDALRALSADYDLSKIVVSLQETGVAAVVVVSRDEWHCPDDVIAAADAHDLPLFHVETTRAAAELERTIARLVVDRQAELNQRATEMYRQLAAVSVEGQGVERILEEAALLTGRLVFVEDAAYHVQAMAPADAAVPSPYSSLVDRQRLEAELRAGELTSSAPPVVRLEAGRNGLARYTGAILNRGRRRGFVSLCALPGELTDLDELVAGRLAAVLALELAKQDAVRLAERRDREALFEQLLAEADAPSPELERQLQRLGFRPDTSIAAVTVTIETETTGTADDAVLDDRSDRLMGTMRRALRDRNQPAIMRSDSGQVVALLALQAVPARSWSAPSTGEYSSADRRRQQTGPGSASAAVKAILQDVHAAAVASGVGPITSGAGETHPRLADAPAAIEEAAQAAQLVRSLYGPGQQACLSDLGLYRLLYHLRGMQELRAFYNQTLGPLAAYDRRTGGDLLATLEAYFASRANLSETARRLNLHRNSLLYRVQRIEETGQVDLQDPEALLALQVALKARHLLDL